ncbi:hypothetical protein, partial [Paraburkholderia sp. SG-MS1]|uniref:hypothetical protein n=1 Tax=Paraburkholderia sp. SG-MS1 TaxID=2023741 RepID=UPI001EEB7F25
MKRARIEFAARPSTQMRGAGDAPDNAQHTRRGTHPARPRTTNAAMSAHRARSTSDAQPDIHAHRAPR